MMTTIERIDYITERGVEVIRKLGEGFDGNGGSKIYKYKDKYYLVRQDGTGNEFYFRHSIQNLCRDEARAKIIELAESAAHADKILLKEGLAAVSEDEFEAAQGF